MKKILDIKKKAHLYDDYIMIGIQPALNKNIFKYNSLHMWYSLAYKKWCITFYNINTIEQAKKYVVVSYSDKLQKVETMQTNFAYKLLILIALNYYDPDEVHNLMKKYNVETNYISEIKDEQ